MKYDQFTGLLEATTEQSWSDIVFSMAKNIGFEQTLFAVLKSKDEPIENSTKDEKVEEGILKLAEQHVTEHEYSQQKPAIKATDVDDTLADETEQLSEQKTIDIEPASTKHS